MHWQYLQKPHGSRVFQALSRAQKGLSPQASSAGLNIHEEAATHEAIESAYEHGVDISSHKPHRFIPGAIDNADRIYAMTETQKRRVVKEFPNARGKVTPLLESIGAEGDIYDPFGKGLRDYQNCAQQIWVAVDKLATQLQRQEPVRVR